MATPLSAKHASVAVAGLESFIQQLHAERAVIDRKISEAEEALRAMRRQSSESANGPRTAGARRKRGENSRQIGELFAAQPGTGLTVGQIASSLKLPASSIANALRKGKGEGLYVQLSDGLWRRKEDVE